MKKLSLYQIQTISLLQSENSCWIYRFQNIGLLIWAQQAQQEHVKPCGSNWVKIKGAQLKINLHRPEVHRMLIKMVKELWWPDASLQSYWNVKFMKNVHVSFCQQFLELSVAITVRKHQITMVLRQHLISIQCTMDLCNLIFNSASSVFT